MVISAARVARLKTGLSLSDAAKCLEISAGHLSEIETGKSQVTAERAERMAMLYGGSLSELFLPKRYSVREFGSE
jgi:transcriptional regulator with XRE-family HTH domain